MDKQLKQNLKAENTWVRGFFMVLFLIIYGISEGIWFLIVLFQFIHTLFTSKPSDPLLDFSENLCAYLYETLLYVSFNSDERPFPFAPWPGEQAGYSTRDVDEVEEEYNVTEGTDQQDREQPENEVGSTKSASEGPESENSV